MSERPSGLSVRMYQVGFGDCFLLTFHYARSFDRHVLIDFGSMKLPKKGAPKEGLAGVAKAIRDVCKTDAYPDGKLTAVVATHRHKDHISGFVTNEDGSDSGNLIAKMIPDLVIQPWTEDPGAETDAEQATGTTGGGPSKAAFVRSLRGMSEFAEAVVKEVQRRSTERYGRAARAGSMLANLAFLGETNLANPLAVKNLMEMGKRTRAEYLSYGDPTDLVKHLPGVNVHVLGPPTLEQTKSILKQRARDPDEFWHLLAMSAIPTAKARAGATKPLFPRRVVPRNQQPPYTRWLIPQLDKITGEQMLELVRILDKALNNTSLILLFEIAGRAFLFPGDAQIENWLYALNHAEDRAEKLAILRRVELYKVGHHGSLNATPKTLWRLFDLTSTKKPANTRRLKTLVSTLHGQHGQEDRGTEVPREKLVKELKAKSDYFSTDSDEMAAVMKAKDSQLCVIRSFVFGRPSRP
ncbi:MAG: hypothetical protein ACLQIB_06635 [Isosphaeraceae bacterium]